MNLKLMLAGAMLLLTVALSGCAYYGPQGYAYPDRYYYGYPYRGYHSDHYYGGPYYRDPFGYYPDRDGK